MPPGYWIGIGTPLLIAGTGMVTWGNWQGSSIALNASKAIEAATGRLEKANAEIAGRAEQINSLVAETVAQLTSQGSFCYVDAFVSTPGYNTIGLFLGHSGKYPVYDVTVEIRDSAISEKFWNQFKQEHRTQVTAADMAAATGVVATMPLGTVIPQSTRQLARISHTEE